MSIRAYRLLRNNKEEGPFTAEEIIQKNLKPYDLIWIDGRSAAWSYPGELAELKKYVPENTVSNLSDTKEANNTISPSVQAAVAMNDTIIQPEIKQHKPRYKVSAAWSKIETVTALAYSDVMVAEPQISSKKIIETNQPVTSESKSLSWKEAWLDWEKEKTITPATEIAKTKPAAAPQPKSINGKYIAPALETKYSEPLDIIKDRYIDNILQQKQKSGRGFSFGKSSEFVIPSLALIIIFSVGYWLLHTTNETASALSSAPVKIQQPPKAENTIILPSNTNNTSATNEVAQNNNSNTQDITSSNEPVLNDQAEDRKTSFSQTAKFTATKEENNLNQQNKFPATQITLPDTKTTAQKTPDNSTKQFDASVINNVPSNNVYNDPSQASSGDLNAQDARPVKRRTNAGDISDNTSTQKNQVTLSGNGNTKSSASYVSVPEYIEMNNGSADLKIENVSDVNLDLVVVDVQYFDASNRFRKGETLYLHNLRAGKNVIVKTPKDINSQYATSKVSLVSSDANNIYVIGDN